MLTFQYLRDANVSRDLEWDPQRRLGAEFKALELAGEVGEACNVVKKISREKLGLIGSRVTAEDLAEELADVVICVDLLAAYFGIDLAAAVEDKFNLTTQKHGFRTFLTPD